jgi:hypothetical protein
MRMRAAFLWSMIVSLSLAALLGIAVLVLPRYGPEEEILLSTGVFGVFSLVALMCAVPLERRMLTPLMWAGVASAWSAVVVWLIIIWFERRMHWSSMERIAQTGGTFTVIACLAALVGLLSLPRFDQRPPSGVRWATVGASVALALQIVCMIWWFDWIDRYIDDEILVRGMGVLAILVACGSVVTPILWKVQAMRRAASADSTPRAVKIALECPRCHTKQAIATGPSRCGQCGLRITLEVEAPHCSCGYLLYHLQSDRCPECGREIAEADRWALSTDPPSPPG